MKYSPTAAATKFIKKYFPQATVAFLGGSAAQRHLNPHSDLDIVIIDDTQVPFKQTYNKYGWTIEAFVMTTRTYRSFFNEARKSALPSLLRMCVEGETIIDDGFAGKLRAEAQAWLSLGPHAWTIDERDQARYEMTECLIDLIDGQSYDENVFVVQRLAELATHFILRTNKQWIGVGKWAVRALTSYDPSLCTAFMQALQYFYKHDSPKPLITFIDKILEPHGGRLLEGWSEGSALSDDTEQDED